MTKFSKFKYSSRLIYSLRGSQSFGTIRLKIWSQLFVISSTFIICDIIRVQVRVETPNLLAANQPKTFAISWVDGHIVVRVGNQNGPLLMEWRDPKPIGVSYIGVRTGWGATGKWNIRFDRTAGPTQHAQPARPQQPPNCGPGYPQHKCESDIYQYFNEFIIRGMFNSYLSETWVPSPRYRLWFDVTVI